MWNVLWVIWVPGLALEKSSETSDCFFGVGMGGTEMGFGGTREWVGR